MKLLMRHVVRYAQSKKAARKERLQRQAAADAYTMLTSYDPR
jgi:hypothetical protein